MAPKMAFRFSPFFLASAWCWAGTAECKQVAWLKYRHVVYVRNAADAFGVLAPLNQWHSVLLALYMAGVYTSCYSW